MSVTKDFWLGNPQTLCDRYWTGMARGGVLPDFRSIRQRCLDDNAIAWEARTPEQKARWDEALAAEARIRIEHCTK